MGFDPLSTWTSHLFWNLETLLWGIQIWGWLWSWSCPSFQTFCWHFLGGTQPLSIRLLFLSLPPFPGVPALPQRLWWRWLWWPGRFKKLWLFVASEPADLDFDGGISGLTSALEYFPTIGVDALWITPIFASPMADFGYDISDYRWGLEIYQDDHFLTLLYFEWTSYFFFRYCFFFK